MSDVTTVSANGDDAPVTALLDGLAGAHRAEVSVWMGGLDGSPWVAHHHDVAYPAASTLKLPLVVAVHRAVERGAVRLRTPVAVHDEFDSAVDGARFRTTRDYDNDPEPWGLLGRDADVGWLAERAIVMSSNLATNLLIELVGAEAVNKVYDDAGATRSALRRGIQDAPAGEAGLRNIGTASDMAAVLVTLANGRLLGPDGTRSVESVLARCRTNEAIPRGVPADVYIAHKTGWIDGACHDAALVRPDGAEPFVLSVFTGAPLDEAAIHRLVADVARLCWEYRESVRHPR